MNSQEFTSIVSDQMKKKSGNLSYAPRISDIPKGQNMSQDGFIEGASHKLSREFCQIIPAQEKLQGKRPLELKSFFNE